MKKKLKGICYPREKVRKLFLMTKLSLILMFFCLQIQANGFSQHTRLSIRLDNVSVKQLFVEIEKMTDLAFVYNTNDVDRLGTVNVDFTNEEIDKILDYCLKGKGVDYSFVNNHIVIKKSETEAPQQQAKRVITGKVMDKTTGEPLPGATIKIKGTTIGTAADINGKFELIIATDVSALEVSFVGYKPVDIPVGKREYVEALMEELAAQMAEVVVTGIFTRKADSYTGSVNTIKADELQRVGNANVLQALRNIDPSFQVLENNQYGSDPNKMPDIQMRGASSFSDMKDKYQTNPNQPLFIVDGFEQSIEKVMDMDMNRVSSVTLLKDATAKALYGSKGANGVVVIETKKPEAGRLRVNYSGSVDIQVPDLNSYDLCNAAEKLEVEKISGIYTSAVNNPIDQQLKDEAYQLLKKEVERGVNTYWMDKPLQTGIGHKHSLNFEGGDEFVRYSVDVNYNDVKGVMKGSDRKTYGGGFTFSYRYKSLLFREQLSISHNIAENSPYGSFSDYTKLNPYWRAYNEDGTLKEVLGNYKLNSGASNPIYNPMINALLNTNNTRKYTDITNNFYIEWNIFQDLKATGRIGIISRTDESDVFYPRDHTKFRKENMTDEEFFKRGEYTKENGKRSDVNSDISLNYSKIFGKHVLFLNGQWSISQRKAEAVNFQAQGFANNKMDYITHAQQYLENGKPFGSESLSRETSILASANYSYDMRYLLDANYRANASSLFGADKRWGHFWSVGLGWNLHNESFLKDKEWLQQMKLRGSTGFTGSQNFNSYQAISTYKYHANEIYDNIIGSYLMSLANPDLQWQKTQDNNVGIDLTIFNLLDVSFDYYVKNTNNLLTPVTLPPSMGFESYVENLGKSQNKGFEARVNVKAISNNETDLHFSVFGSVMHNTNKIKEISSALSSINDAKDSDKGLSYNPDDKNKTTKPSVRYQEGQSMSAIWAVRSLGIDPGTGNELFLTKDGDITYTWNAKDQVVCGDELPKYTGTFGFNFDWKGFIVNTSFYFRLGGQMYNQTLVDKVENCDFQYNVDKRVYTGRWTTPGQEAQYKKLTDPAYFTRPTSRFVQDLSELQMTSLNVGYDFRNCAFMKKGVVQHLKLSFYMNDVFRASTVKIERGTDYPFARSFSFQLQASF